jgi:VWFA-related protein
VFLATPFLLAQTPAEPPVVRFRNTVRLVEVDVVAKDKHGKPVADLEAQDFTLFDNGQPQKIKAMSVERGTPALAGAAVGSLAAELTAQPKPATFSNDHTANAAPTVILFDTLNTTRENQATMRTELMQSLDHIKEGTPVALLILGEDLTVVSDFTTARSPWPRRQAANLKFVRRGSVRRSQRTRRAMPPGTV